MRISRSFRLIALVVFAAALCASVAPLCFDSADCLHGCNHGSSALGTHSASVGMMGLLVIGVTAFAATVLRDSDEAQQQHRCAHLVPATATPASLRAVPLRI